LVRASDNNNKKKIKTWKIKILKLVPTKNL